ncbi:MAG: SCP2 sterol-binding domain-containing protein, partial [Myxococcota bacterium]
VSADIFGGIDRYVKSSPELVQKVQTVFQFRLSDPASVWTIDVKNGSGGASPGESPKADTVLEISDADFMDMCTGKADPQKLYFGGKLKISGDVMASQKLTFLKKVDPKLVEAAMAERVGGVSSAPEDAGGSLPDSVPIFLGIQAYVEQHPELVQNVDRVFLFKMNEPESAWTIDLKNGSGSVTEGDPGGAGCTLELTEADFVAMSRGEADPQKLYFGGKLKITGDVMASQKLDFLQKIDPASMKDEVERRIAEYRSGERAPVEAAPGREAVAWTVFDKLSARLESKPELGAEVGAAIRFEIQNPDVSFVVELQEGTAKVHKGGDHRADTVLTMSDEDLEALVKGAEASQLYQRGQLRVDGDVQVAQRLAFIRGLL